MRQSDSVKNDQKLRQQIVKDAFTLISYKTQSGQSLELRYF